MALDPVPTYPGQYNASEASNNPSGSETRREGDDQIRRMKASEKATWTNVNGPVTASEAEINRLTGISLTDPIITLASGTKMVFYQASAPTGWTLDATVDEHSIALTSTLGGTIGGTKNFTSVFQTHAEGAADGVGDHTITLAEMASHDHGGGNHDHTADSFNTPGTAPSFENRVTVNPGSQPIVNNSGTILNTEGGGQPHGHSLDLDVRRAYCIVATKD